ncbi:MAG: hypothetical protein Q8R30_02530 [bacterium]|nr:hypothetical protein [bacterium]MDZ4285744.1 hypothetical protein [Candidatus Sungbacteria bacterium]
MSIIYQVEKIVKGLAYVDKLGRNYQEKSLAARVLRGKDGDAPD